MIAVAQNELYRLRTVRAWWLTLPAAVALCLTAGMIDQTLWTFVVGAVVFLVGVVGTAQHYQHGTAILLFLARPQRLTVLLGHTLVYAALGAAVAAITGLGLVARQEWSTYGATIGGACLLAAFAVANAAIVRRPVWIISGYGSWLLVGELLLGQLQMPGPFTGYLAASVEGPASLLILAAWTTLAMLVAARAVERDVPEENDLARVCGAGVLCLCSPARASAGNGRKRGFL
jgi:ABC-2 type transport system ATP-binding protein